MTFYDLFDRIDAHHVIPATADRRSGAWAIPRPADLRVLLVFSVIWLLVSSFAGNSDFLMALATSLAICANLVHLSRSKDLVCWTHYIAWIMRIGAAISIWWLFAAIPSIAISWIAVLLFAALYFVCERSVWRHACTAQKPAA
jgi:hypothetical protein